MKIQRILLLCLCAGLISVFACSSPMLYSKKHFFDGETWAYADTLSYAWDVQDTSEVYNMSIVLEHDVDFGFQNVYIKFLSKFPKSDWVEQISPINLAVNSGNG